MRSQLEPRENPSAKTFSPFDFRDSSDADILVTFRFVSRTMPPHVSALMNAWVGPPLAFQDTAFRDKDISSQINENYNQRLGIMAK